MRFCLIIATLTLTALQIGLPQARAQNWYWWCDASNAGYPWVRTCATPWRLVVPSSPTPQTQAPRQPATPPLPSLNDSASQSATPEPTPAPLSPPLSNAFQDGQADRQAWEAWFNSRSGDYRAGAEYWAGRRSLRNPGSCGASPPSISASWTAGCLAARDKLTRSDRRRKTEPDYRLGWNNPGPLTSLPTATENAGTRGGQVDIEATGVTQIQVPPTSTSQPLIPEGRASNTEQPSASGSPATPVEAKSPTEDKPSTTPQSSSAGWVIPSAVILIAGGWAIQKGYNVIRRRRQEEDALQIAKVEIDYNASNLRVKRLQTVLPDHYGSVSLAKWNKEKDYYIQTRILPALRAKGLEQMYGPLATTIETMIELAAQRPIASTSATPNKHVSNPEIFDPRMDPIDYEKYCALQLERAGWSTRLTPATGDQGADVIAHRGSKILVLQCKLYGSPVGNDAVQQVFAARQFQSADLAAVVSNQPFTKSAKELANVNGVYLLHHEQLASFIR